jgi:hypothetical protein
MLFTNMNNLDRLYYDMFINRTPLTLTLERYNESGVLESFQVPNRAMDRQGENKLQGKGSPERTQQADSGTIYLDILTNDIWFKTTDDSTTGWIKLYTPVSFVAGENYLAPDGDASQLTGLNLSNLTGGILGTRSGGTGTGRPLRGVIKGMGTEPFTEAVPGVDYMYPQAFIGSLGLFMRDVVDDEQELPSLLQYGWLPCNGAHYNKEDYPALYQALKYTYPNRVGDTTDFYGNPITLEADEFAVPDFRDMYLRGWTDARGIHSYQACAVPNVKGEFFNSQESETELAYQHPNQQPYGCFKRKATAGTGVGGSGGWFEILEFDASNYKPLKDSVAQASVYKDDVYEVRTNNLSTLICIYAGIQGVTYDYQGEVNN